MQIFKKIKLFQLKKYDHCCYRVKWLDILWFAYHKHQIKRVHKGHVFVLRQVDHKLLVNNYLEGVRNQCGLLNVDFRNPGQSVTP